MSSKSTKSKAAVQDRVLVTGGGGYLGTVLVPLLLSKNYRVRVLDTFWFGNFLPYEHSHLEIIKGDLRNETLLRSALVGVTKIVHLACLSNDPTSDVDPELTRDINYHASKRLIALARDAGVRRFVYASSSSVYGIKGEGDVTEDLLLEPISLYAELKARIEQELFAIRDDNFTTTAVRSATICGYSPRMRLDLLVNILTVSALAQGVIHVDGGAQVRANIHIKDIAAFYLMLLEADHHLVHHQAFNANHSNSTVLDMAKRVSSLTGAKIEFTHSRDPRSYSLSDKKARRVFNFKNQYSVNDAIHNVKSSFEEGRIRIDDLNCYNLKKLLLLGIERIGQY